MLTPPKKKRVFREVIISSIEKTANFFWEVVDIWSYKNEKIASYYDKSVGDEYTTEYKSFRINEGDTVLHIGCGAYPLTAMKLAKLLNVNVVGIDKNPRAIQLAQDVVKREGFNGTITIDKGNGTSYPVGSFDVVIVSACSSPKLEILEHLFNHAKPNSTIIVRELNIMTKDILSLLESYRDVILLKKIHHHPHPFLLLIAWDAMFLKKKQ